MLAILIASRLVGLCMAQNPSQECWYDVLCGYDELSESDLIDPLYDTLEKQMVYCQSLCYELRPDAGGLCEHFTVHTARGTAYCYKLPACESASSGDLCLAQGTCNSGPADCANNNNCLALAPNLDPTVDEILWQCDGGGDPYQQDVLMGTTCFLRYDEVKWLNILCNSVPAATVGRMKTQVRLLSSSPPATPESGAILKPYPLASLYPLCRTPCRSQTVRKRSRLLALLHQSRLLHAGITTSASLTLMTTRHSPSQYSTRPSTIR